MSECMSDKDMTPPDEAPVQWGESVRDLVCSILADTVAAALMRSTFRPNDCDKAADAILSALSPLPHSGEAVAWQFELAKGIEHRPDGTRVYHDFERKISVHKPNVPEGSIRNLTPLYATPVQSRDEVRATSPVGEGDRAWPIVERDDDGDISYRIRTAEGGLSIIPQANRVVMVRSILNPPSSETKIIDLPSSPAGERAEVEAIARIISNVLAAYATDADRLGYERRQKQRQRYADQAARAILSLRTAPSGEAGE